MRTNQKEKINFVISTLSGGGAQRVVSVLSFALGHKYDFYITLHDSSRINYPYDGRMIDLGIPVDNLLIKKFYNAFRRVLALNRVKKQLKAKATISFMESSNFINILSGKVNKTIISVRNHKSKRKSTFTGKVFNYLIKKLYNRSDHIVAASQGIKQNLIVNFGINCEVIKVIHNPYNIKEISNHAKEKIEGKYAKIFSRPVIITSGRLCKQKGQWHLIRAFKEVKRIIPEAVLVILGTGELKPLLEDYVQRVDLKDHVYLLGFKSNPHKFVANSNIFAFPSLYEGFPNALVEAMACEVPIVSSDCRSGPREILAPSTNYMYQTKEIEMAKYGVLTPVCSGIIMDPEVPLSREETLLAEAITSLLKVEELANTYRKQSIARVNDYDVSIIAEQWINLIDSQS